MQDESCFGGGALKSPARTSKTGLHKQVTLTCPLNQAQLAESLFLERDLSYHGDEVRWKREGKRIGLQTVGRGQEFVFDGNGIPERTDTSAI